MEEELFGCTCLWRLLTLKLYEPKLFDPRSLRDKDATEFHVCYLMHRLIFLITKGSSELPEFLQL